MSRLCLRQRAISSYQFISNFSQLLLHKVVLTYKILNYVTETDITKKRNLVYLPFPVVRNTPLVSEHGL